MGHEKVEWERAVVEAIQGCKESERANSDQREATIRDGARIAPDWIIQDSIQRRGEAVWKQSGLDCARFTE